MRTKDINVKAEIFAGDCSDAEACEMKEELLDSPEQEVLKFNKWINIPCATPISDGYNITFKPLDIEIIFNRRGNKNVYIGDVTPEHIGWINTKVDEFFASLESAYKEHAALGEKISQMISEKTKFDYADKKERE